MIEVRACGTRGSARWPRAATLRRATSRTGVLDVRTDLTLTAPRVKVAAPEGWANTLVQASVQKPTISNDISRAHQQ